VVTPTELIVATRDLAHKFLKHIDTRPQLRRTRYDNPAPEFCSELVGCGLWGNQASNARTRIGRGKYIKWH
jgi:hypothetical protein